MTRLHSVQRCLFALAACLLLIGTAAAQTPTQIIQNAPWFERSVGQGATWKTCHFDNLFSSEQDIFVLTADMDVTGTLLRFPYRAGGTRVTVPVFATDYANTLACINGNFFDTVGNTGSVQYLKVNGVLINTTLDVTIADEGAVVIDSSEVVDMIVRPGAGYASLAHPNIMASNIPLVSGGALYAYPNIPFYQSDRHPRSGAGITADNHLLFVVVDGRTARADGMTMVEFQTTLQALGAVNATNLDGGGSSTFWARGEPGNSVVNYPSDGTLRAVPNGLSLIGDTTVTPLTYDSRFTGATYNSTMVSGTTQVVTMSFVNKGTTAWGPTTILDTTQGRERTSQLYTASDWTSASRPGALDQASVLAGGTGTFSFVITAPAVGAPTTLKEDFGMRDTVGGWLGPEQNRLRITVMPPPSSGTVIVEARSDGQNNAYYSETGGWADSGVACSAPGLTSTGMRYGSTYRTVAGAKACRFTPNLPGGQYKVYVSWGAGSSRRSPIRYIVHHASGDANHDIDQAATANAWQLLGTYSFNAGTGGYVEMNNSQVDLSGSMYAAGAMFEPVVPAFISDWALY